MMKNKLMLVVNILYSLFAVLFTIVSILINFNGNVVPCIIAILLMIITIIGLWYLYLSKLPKQGITILQVKSILKYIALTIALFVILIFLVALQDCANNIFVPGDQKTEVSPAERMRVVLPIVGLMVFTTIYFVFYQIFMVMFRKEKFKKGLVLIFTILHVLLTVMILADFVMSITGISGFITQVFTNNGENVNMIAKVLAYICELAYVSVYGITSYMLINKYIQISKENKING